MSHRASPHSFFHSLIQALSTEGTAGNEALSLLSWEETFAPEQQDCSVARAHEVLHLFLSLVYWENAKKNKSHWDELEIFYTHIVQSLVNVSL